MKIQQKIMKIPLKLSRSLMTTLITNHIGIKYPTHGLHNLHLNLILVCWRDIAQTQNKHIPQFHPYQYPIPQLELSKLKANEIDSKIISSLDVN